jgi:hypothetical protein
VFAQGCPADTGGQPRGCYVVNDGGDTGCLLPIDSIQDAQRCDLDVECAPGLTCHLEGGPSFCRHFCGGPGSVACPPGEPCGPFSATIPSTTIGVCGNPL